MTSPGDKGRLVPGGDLAKAQCECLANSLAPLQMVTEPSDAISTSADAKIRARENPYPRPYSIAPIQDLDVSFFASLPGLKSSSPVFACIFSSFPMFREFRRLPSSPGGACRISRASDNFSAETKRIHAKPVGKLVHLRLVNNGSLEYTKTSK